LAWRVDQFNYFKLHGSIAYGGVPANFSYDELFVQAAPERFEFLNDDWFVNSYVPPVVFPWELFDQESGDFISENDFIFVKGKNQEGKKLFNHFKIMWENAKLSVECADKISFVGLSQIRHDTRSNAPRSGKSGHHRPKMKFAFWPVMRLNAGPILICEK